jgi:hypothetical protein
MENIGRLRAMRLDPLSRESRRPPTFLDTLPRSFYLLIFTACAACLLFSVCLLTGKCNSTDARKVNVELKAVRGFNPTEQGNANWNRG